MTWWAASRVARAGRPVRRRASTTTTTYLFVAGIGTTRAVAVTRSNGVDSVVTPTTFTSADFLADDWEEVTT
jgi:hypothetical protein